MLSPALKPTGRVWIFILPVSSAYLNFVREFFTEKHGAKAKPKQKTLHECMQEYQKKADEQNRFVAGMEGRGDRPSLVYIVCTRDFIFSVSSSITFFSIL